MNKVDLEHIRLHLVGCGKMGTALLEGWLKAGMPSINICARVATEASANALFESYNIHAATNVLYAEEEAVVFAVKPQILPEVLAESWHPAPSQPLYISLAAGITLESLQQALGKEARIVRAMPNTPALVGQGITTLCATPLAEEKDRVLTEALFAATGKALWVENEAQLTAATAVAGSGPAYVFYFAECLMRAAQEIGLPLETAHALVTQTLKGSVALAEAENWAVERLRQDVTSKGGVTAAALTVLQDNDRGLASLFTEALHANIKRSKELASGK